jgi:hypothetical protein
MGIYNFICGPQSYDAFPKWPARTFGLATPGLDNVGSLTSHNLIGLYGLLRGQLLFLTWSTYGTTRRTVLTNFFSDPCILSLLF